MENQEFAKAKKLYEKAFEGEVADITPIGQSGSARRYFRLHTERDTMLMCASDNIKENVTFVNLSKYLREKGIPVPEILAVSEDGGSYLLEDFGDLDLLHFLQQTEADESTSVVDSRTETIQATIECLVDFQLLPQNEWEDIVEFPPLGSELIRYDFNYALENLLRVLVPNLDESKLWAELEYLEKKLLAYPRRLWGLMYRDFQSRNIMLAQGPHFIDYQSARFGPGIYDLVSFAWQAKAGFNQQERERIAELYINALEKRGVKAANEIRDNLKYWVAFRILQTLGAYGLRGLKEGKRHFIESIPPALRNITDLFASTDLSAKLPELSRILNDSLN